MFDRAEQVCTTMSCRLCLMCFSSNSLSLLPSEPKIFHGRETELSAIIRAFEKDAPRIAILGAGGMGKTSLARAVVHHSEISNKYDQSRIFVACDSALTPGELYGLIGSHLGLKPGKDIAKAVLTHLAGQPPSVLILDNLETLWEPVETREAIEELLSLLTGIQHLALIVSDEVF